MQPNPYAEDLGDRDPLTALTETPQQIRALVENWTDEMFERSYAPGKWSARKLRRMNMIMWQGLTAAQKNHTFTHPEFGQLNVTWILEQMAGHDIHHLEQFQQIR